MSRIAFVGLGRMGRGMAGRLLAAGHDVVVFNRTADTAAALVRDGARPADSPRAAADRADAVFVMVSDDQASASVWQGDDGLLAADLPPGALAIECSTLSHDWVLQLSAAARARGLRFLDAPVTGLPDAAAAGRLTLLVGAEQPDLDAAEPLLAALSADRLHFGPVGSGTAYKLMINLMGAVQIGAAAEGMALAERAGLDVHQVARAIAAGQAASPQVVRNTRRMADGDHAQDVVFSGRLRRKDADYGVRLADALGLRAPFGRAALAGLDRLLAAGLGDQNESSIVEVARRDGRAPAEPSGTHAAGSGVRATYDAIARAYDSQLADELDHKPLDRALLAGFLELVGPRGRVADVGCGPGHVTRHLAQAHPDVIGIDLSPGMIEVARERAPALDFAVGSVLQLPVAEAAWAGAIALYSIIHLRPEERATAFAELARTVQPGGWLLVAFHVDSPDFAIGDVNHLTEWFGEAVDVDAFFLDPAEVARDVETAGFAVMSTVIRRPTPGVEFPSRRCYLLAQRGQLA